jgi:hypothetical protein
MIFKKVQEGCKIRRTYRILGYTRRDKLFIAFEAARNPVDKPFYVNGLEF